MTDTHPSTGALMSAALRLGTAIPAFNIPYHDMMAPVVRALRDTRTVGLITVARLEWEKFQAGSLEAIRDTYAQVKDECFTRLHLDHCPVIDEDQLPVDYMEVIGRAIAAGYESVMVDGSRLVLAENIYVPADGVQTPQGLVSFNEVAQRLADAVAALTRDPKKAAMILATVQSPQTLALLAEMQSQGAQRGTVLLAPQAYPHPDWPAARTSTPLMLRVSKTERDLYGEERFGPISFVIACDDAQDALAQATRDAREFGGLTAFVYATDEAYIAQAQDAYARAGAQLTINLTGAMPLNFAAAYSDYHVTGLNPAGNAALTHLAFVANRFCVTQSRRPARADTPVDSH